MIQKHNGAITAVFAFDEGLNGVDLQSLPAGLDLFNYTDHVLRMAG
jgi:hypothetical protein